MWFNDEDLVSVFVCVPFLLLFMIFCVVYRRMFYIFCIYSFFVVAYVFFAWCFTLMYFCIFVVFVIFDDSFWRALLTKKIRSCIYMFIVCVIVYDFFPLCVTY